ncbi:MAG TPA: hypothetical protein VM285_07765 [Polyangia bacterium]|nr:hypothetical protein [Polyangia bacterium]
MGRAAKTGLVVAGIGGIAALVVLSRPPVPAGPTSVALGDRGELPSYRAPVPVADSGVARTHGPADVVRSRDHLGDRPAERTARPRFDPDWNNPLRLTFAGLKRYRREYDGQGDFSEETARVLSGAAVLMKGAVMPIDPVPESGEMRRFWLANPVLVMAGCVFCNPPTMADIVYVTTPPGAPFRVDRERLYRSVVNAEIIGRLVLGPGRGEGGVEYLFGLELSKIDD